MKAAEMGGQTFIWKRVNAITDHFSLQSGDRALALLKIGGLHGVVARLTSEDLALAFVVEGIADRYINVRDSTTGATLAFYERGRRGVGGKLQLADGGRLDWMRLASWRPAIRRNPDGFWRPDYVLADTSGRPLVRFGLDGTILCSARARWDMDKPPLELLVVLALGWILIMLAAE